MDRGSSVIVTELERELPSTVLTEYAKRIARSLRPKVIALRRSLKCWPRVAKHVKETTRATYARAYTRPYQKTGTGKLKLNGNLPPLESYVPPLEFGIKKNSPTLHGDPPKMKHCNRFIAIQEPF